MGGASMTFESIIRTVKFFEAFLKAPGVTGAIAPSSRRLAETMVDWLDWNSADVVMEIGPGTGSFTEVILERKPPSCRFLAVEVNEEMCAILQQRFPTLEICAGSVADVAGICEKECVQEVDAVISGLPWAAFSSQQQQEYLEALMCVLRRGGQFTTFAYLHGLPLPAGQRFRRKLHRYFSTVEQTRVIWANLPPAIVYRCRR